MKKLLFLNLALSGVNFAFAIDDPSRWWNWVVGGLSLAFCIYWLIKGE